MTPTTGPREAWLFDMDGVLVDSEASARRGWERWCATHGLDPAPFVETMQGRPGADKIRELAPHLDAEAEADKITALEISDTAGVTAFPGAAHLLQWPGVAIGVVTSAKVALGRARLQAAGLRVPEVVIGGDTVTNGKPDPEPYLLAAERLRVPPPRCTVFEDAPAGVASGLAAGMRVIALRTTFPEAGPLGAAHLIVRDLSEYLLWRSEG